MLKEPLDPPVLETVSIAFARGDAEIEVLANANVPGRSELGGGGGGFVVPEHCTTTPPSGVIDMDE